MDLSRAALERLRKADGHSFKTPAGKAAVEKFLAEADADAHVRAGMRQANRDVLGRPPLGPPTNKDLEDAVQSLGRKTWVHGTDGKNLRPLPQLAKSTNPPITPEVAYGLLVEALELGVLERNVINYIMVDDDVFQRLVDESLGSGN